MGHGVDRLFRTHLQLRIFSVFPFGQSSHFRLAIYSVFAALLLVARFVAERVGATLAGCVSRRSAKAVVVHLLLVVAILVAVVQAVHLAWPLDVVRARKGAFTSPGFETGKLAPWGTYQQIHAEISSDRAHGGKYSLAESEGVGSVFQDITGLVPGRKYRIVAWASASLNATAPVQIVVYDSVAEKSAFSNPVTISTPVTFGIWHTISQEVTASSSGTLRIHLFRLQGTGTVYWDDVHVFEDE